MRAGLEIISKRVLAAFAVASTASLPATACFERFDGCGSQQACSDDPTTGGTSNSGGTAPGSAGMGAGPSAPSCEPACDDPTPLCVENTNQCVECLDHSDCTDNAAARCDAGVCKPCTESSQCSGSDATVCDVKTGKCVECAPGDHAPCGADKLCHGQLRKCVDALPANAPTCGTCVADAHCKDGFHCVAPELFGEEGYFCLPEPNPGCTTRRPFVNRLEDLVSIDGNTVTVCAHRFTSCAGFNDFSVAVEGCSEATDPPPDGDGNAACGLPGTADNTRCRAFEAEARCTYHCSSADDCLCGHDCVGQVCDFSPTMEVCED